MLGGGGMVECFSSERQRKVKWPYTSYLVGYGYIEQAVSRLQVLACVRGTINQNVCHAILPRC